MHDGESAHRRVTVAVCACTHTYNTRHAIVFCRFRARAHRRGAARRVGIRATTARGKAIFLRSQLQREYDEAWRKYVSLNNLHNARDIGREGGRGREARKPSRDLYRRLSRRDVSRLGSRRARIPFHPHEIFQCPLRT